MPEKRVTDARLVKVLQKLELTKPDRDKSRPLKTSLPAKFETSPAKKKASLFRRHYNGAGEGIRTLDINLGKVALYP